MDWDIAFTFAQDTRHDLRLSYYKVENEFLFTMHTVSRVATQGSSEWNRLGKFLLAIGKFDKVEEVFQIFIEESSEDDLEQLGHAYHLMGSVKENKNE
ncbi:unnamed protein product [Rotaria magnacalcarata]|uniref:Tetratricopeptide repeat protein n=1 Tax=Rotaria magnacalcarata TaxID=392030 RepID=A0A8S3IHM9_9BILA|nr:unnamed protein product [Rotaria magnacalcarata]